MNKVTLNASQLADIIRWVDTIRGTNCTSFADVALRHPEIWCALRKSGFQRRIVAQASGWPLRLDAAQVRDCGAFELGTLLLNHGHDNALDFWNALPRLCHALHCEGKLSDALEFVRLCVQTDADSANPAPKNARLEPFGFIQAWLRLDPEGAKTALEQHEIDSALSTLVVMPPPGWTTAGGVVFDLPELIIARLLEGAGIEFLAPESVSERDGGNRFRDAFRLLRHPVIIRVGGLHNLRRERVGEETLRESGLRIVCVDDRLIDSAGSVVGFSHHVVESLLDAGVRCELR